MLRPHTFHPAVHDRPFSPIPWGVFFCPGPCVAKNAKATVGRTKMPRAPIKPRRAALALIKPRPASSYPPGGRSSSFAAPCALIRCQRLRLSRPHKAPACFCRTGAFVMQHAPGCVTALRPCSYTATCPPFAVRSVCGSGRPLLARCRGFSPAPAAFLPHFIDNRARLYYNL